MKKQGVILKGLILGLSLSLFFLSHFAFGGIGITVAPVKYKLDVDPGTVIDQTINVSNPNDTVLKVRPEFQNFKVIEGNNIQWLPGDIENPYQIADWIEGIDTSKTITLKPQEEKRVPFRIRVPKNATAGGHYGAVFFTGVLEGETGNVGAIPRVGSLIILNVTGDLKMSGKLISLKGPWFVNQGPVTFSINFLNTGTTHYEIKADMKVNNFFWNSGEFVSEQKIVYPNISREVKATWEQKVLLGFYRVKAVIKDGDGNTHEASKIFIGFPYKYLLLFLILIVVLSILYHWFKKRFKLVKI